MAAANQLLSSLSKFIQTGLDPTHQDRPVFDGSNGLKFLNDFNSWCALHDIKAKSKPGELCSCASTTILSKQLRQGCVTSDANGRYAPKSWTAVVEWFKLQFAIATDTDDMIKQANRDLHHAESYMRDNESIIAYITRFNFLIEQINQARDAWNVENKPVGAAASWVNTVGYRKIEGGEKNALFLERLNRHLYEYATKFQPRTDTWEDIVKGLKQKDNIRNRVSIRFGIPAPPTSALNSAVHPDRLSQVQPDADSKYRELQEKLDATTKALATEKVAHEKTRMKAVKGKSFTPVNSVSSAELICTLCSGHGHIASDCKERICTRCAAPHFSEDCDSMYVDLWCKICRNIGHVVDVCPYRFTGRLPWMAKRTREEATKAYRKKMSEKNAKNPSNPKKDKPAKPKKSAAQQQGSKIPDDVCRNFVNGYKCAFNPCRYRHPGSKPSKKTRARSHSPKGRRLSRSPSPRRTRSRHSNTRTDDRSRSRSISPSAGRARPRSSRRDRNTVNYVGHHASQSRSRSSSGRRSSRRDRSPLSRDRSRNRSSSSSRGSRSRSPEPPGYVRAQDLKFIQVPRNDYADLVRAQARQQALYAQERNLHPESKEATDGLSRSLGRNASAQGRG